MQRYLDVKDDLHTGWTPRISSDELTVKDLLNRFLTTKQNLGASNELSPRTFRGYKDSCNRIIEAFGKTQLVDDLASDDFEGLRRDIAKGRGPVATGNEVQRIRTVFKYEYEAGLIEDPVRFGPRFRRPSKKTLRKERQKNGKKEFSAQEIKSMLEDASLQLKAMILLGMNAAFGNSDCATLPMDAVNLKTGWVTYPRSKSRESDQQFWEELLKALDLPLVYRGKTYILAKAGDVRGIISPKGSQHCA